MVEFGNRSNISIPWPELAGDLLEEYMQQFLAGCNTVVALNQPVAEGLREWGYTGRLDIIPNGRELHRFSGLRNASLSDPEKRLVFTGFLSERKNQEYLLEVMRYLPGNYRLQLVGEPLSEEYRDRLLDLIAEWGLGNVELTGAVPFQHIPAVLEQAHLMASASLHEVQSLAVIEALASGTPVVGLANETVDELVDEGVGARLPKETSPQDFARQVQAVCELPQAGYDLLCASARRRVSHLDWDNVIELTGKMYAELIEAAGYSDTGQVTSRPALEDLIANPQIPASVREGLVELSVRLEQVRRVPAPTWFYAALNVLGASLIKPLLKG
jgi:glycosyltransferase involved in cell wall biosynthesis